MRVRVTLACTECKQRNYNTMKNKKNDPDRLEMNKFCPFCRKPHLGDYCLDLSLEQCGITGKLSFRSDQDK